MIKSSWFYVKFKYAEKVSHEIVSVVIGLGCVLCVVFYWVNIRYFIKLTG